MVGSDGTHVGTVDHVDNGEIKLTKKDPAGWGAPPLYPRGFRPVCRGQHGSPRPACGGRSSGSGRRPEPLPAANLRRNTLASHDDVAPSEPETPPPTRSVETAKEPAELADAGPTGPSSVEPSAEKGPSTGGYDDHSPSNHPTNEKGGYGRWVRSDRHNTPPVP